MHCGIRELLRLFPQTSFTAQPSKQTGWNLQPKPLHDKAATPQKCKHQEHLTLESLCNEEIGMQNTEGRGLCPPAEQIPKSIAPVISKASATNALQLPGRSALPVPVGREESGLLIGPA